MVEVVVVDDRGRVVIPRGVRERLGLSRGSRLLLVELGSDTIVLRKLDVRTVLEEIAREVKEKGVPLERIEHEVEKEASEVASKRIEEILAGH
ncbi:AbrB/MazE/SpoVT family DNA-binding domain-containing protein [Infirmifilum lucidum]|uniref:AbrB/MazE/SpoVT family DNA-binding domain-containing protein n=1 Tax=Infirmifilum lucidum TaxID=2776706 RepID=A0A7L9FI94_9CREN|nr:AbrB/MazE/SpoVT family DNA-binding domain-containing protein [Infirmifilum lucidum]QOJ78644.1 AbrB/MazE/SpoVT family DNA-binding domain-containing protein [Infirmifilum lucidum]